MSDFNVIYFLRDRLCRRTMSATSLQGLLVQLAEAGIDVDALVRIERVPELH